MNPRTVTFNYIFKNYKPAHERRLENRDFQHCDSSKTTGGIGEADILYARMKLRKMDRATACTYHPRRGYMLVKIKVEGDI